MSIQSITCSPRRSRARTLALLIAAAGLLACALLLTVRPVAAQDGTVYLPIAARPSTAPPPQRTVAAGSAHSCAIVPDGSVRCWGANDMGQLGDGNPSHSAPPVTVQGLPSAIAIAAGGNTTCAVTRGGVYCWGDGYGWSPRRIEGAPPALDIRVALQSCVISTEHGVVCWNAYQAPAPIDGLTDASTFAPGILPCVLTLNGGIKCWEIDFIKDVPAGVFTWPGVTGARAAGSFRLSDIAAQSLADVLCVTDAAGATACWEGNCYFPAGCIDPPTAPERRAPWATGAQALYGANRTLCALLADGRVACGGEPEYGEGGLGTSDGRGMPVLGVAGATSLAVGGSHVCAMLADSRVRCWGTNSAGQLGNSDAIGHLDLPVAMPAGAIKQVAGGSTATCRVDLDGQIGCWGASTQPFASPGELPARATLQPVALPAPAAQVVVGGDSACARMPGTGLACWPLDWQSSPTLLPGTQQAIDVTAAMDDTCYVGGGGGVYCFSGAFGIQHKVQGLPKARALAVNDYGGCALTEYQRVACWQRRDETPWSAQSVPSLIDVRQVAMTATGACALRSDGNVFCWTIPNSYGQPPEIISNPHAVQGLDHIRALSSITTPYVMRLCALRDDGTVLCWNGTVTEEVARVPGAAGLAAGVDHLCVTVGTDLFCQGDNSRGQLLRNPGWTPVEVQGLLP